MGTGRRGAHLPPPPEQETSRRRRRQGQGGEDLLGFRDRSLNDTIQGGWRILGIIADVTPLPQPIQPLSQFGGLALLQMSLECSMVVRRAFCHKTELCRRVITGVTE